MFQVYRQCKENVWLEDSNAKPVGIELYIESLCPDCKNFITDQLSPAFRNVLPIMNLTIIPYGNAMVNLKAGEEFGMKKCQYILYLMLKIIGNNLIFKYLKVIILCTSPVR